MDMWDCLQSLAVYLVLLHRCETLDKHFGYAVARIWYNRLLHVLPNFPAFSKRLACKNMFFLGEHLHPKLEFSATHDERLHATCEASVQALDALWTALNLIAKAFPLPAGCSFTSWTEVSTSPLWCHRKIAPWSPIDALLDRSAKNWVVLGICLSVASGGELMPGPVSNDTGIHNFAK